MEEWINKMTNGWLPSHIAWLGYRLQLWAGIRYGIGTMTNGLEKANITSGIGNCLHSQKRMEATPHNFRGLRSSQLPNGTIDWQTQPTTPTLSHIIKAQSKTGCITTLLTTTTSYSYISILSRLQQMELPFPSMLSKSIVANTQCIIIGNAPSIHRDNLPMTTRSSHQWECHR